ncbi:hypothetical protein [Salinimicrobium xinjiangense]|uniref:hypothetical protein n=1 Tax=Salinimicrobium xinjiangense TaxID=438596 RepID=UPI00040524A2|nr:hypothetical protein [Salinimicrobium xinjiangense]
MQVKPQIKASILLGLFSLLLLHQTIPHIHHEHQEKNENRLVKHSHGNSHGHEHKHENERNPKNSKSLLSILLATHSHGGSSTEIPVVEESIQHILLKKVKTESSSPQDFLLKNKLPEVKAAELQRNYQPPPDYLHSYLAFLSLRGPPRTV